MPMIKGLLPMVYTSAGVAAAGTTGYVVLNPEILTGEPEQQVVGLLNPAPEKVEEVKEQEVAALPQVKEEEKVPDPIVPAFTLLRVEKDGSTVVAGTGPAKSDISLLNAGKEISRTVSQSNGDFAFVLDNPLAPGLHELHLLAVTPKGIEVASTEAGIINVPEPEQDKEPTVLVSEAGEATRVLQQPEPEVAKVEEPKQAEPVPAPEILIEAADIESGKLYIAGKGEPGWRVNIYLANKLLGETLTAPNGAFLFEKAIDIKPGQHAVRADMIEQDSSSVLARAEVELVHNPEVVVATAPEPKAEDPTPRKVIRTGSAVIIRRGDNLWRVARRSYGEGLRYTTIFEANKDQVRDPDLIYPGQVLKLPENTQG